MTGDSEFAEEWEKFCKDDYMDWKKTHPPPCISNFAWSGGGFFNAHERWSDEHRRHYMRTGEAWWNERGFTVTSWPRSNLPITVAPIERKI